MPMNEGYAVLASAKKKVIKKRPEDMGRGKKVAVAKKTAPMKPQPAKPGYSAANISSSRSGPMANHSLRSAPQVIRSRDTELRGKRVGTGTGTGYKSSSSSASRQTGGRAKESMPGVRGSGEMMALKGTGKTLRSGTGTGTGYKPNSAAGRGKGGEMMGSNKSSSAQAGKFAPKKKAPMRGSKY